MIMTVIDRDIIFAMDNISEDEFLIRMESFEAGPLPKTNSISINTSHCYHAQLDHLVHKERVCKLKHN